MSGSSRHLHACLHVISAERKRSFPLEEQPPSRLASIRLRVLKTLEDTEKVSLST